ncbi:MAG: hypothetical protein WCS94_02660 [Verrucomicrobiota bacterium]
MSTNLVPILIDEKLLAGEIARLGKIVLPEEFDNFASEIHFHDALRYEDISPEERQYAFASFSASNNTRDCFDADEIRFQLLHSTRDSNSTNAAKSADTLFRFIGDFFVHNRLYIPFNEYGLTGSVIIGLANARRLHLFFQKIDFDLLRPFYVEHCKKYAEGMEINRVKSFEEFVSFVTAFDDLLLQAMEKNKALYIFAS